MKHFGGVISRNLPRGKSNLPKVLGPTPSSTPEANEKREDIEMGRVRLQVSNLACRSDY